MPTLHGPLGACGAVVLVVSQSGCVPNSSNPVVSVVSARMSDQQATVDLRIRNPGRRALTIESVDYELSHGEMSFPLASGAWTGRLDLPKGGAAELPLTVPFDTEPIETGSTLLHLSGQLHTEDHTGYLGLRSMDLTSTPFQIDVQARRGDQ